MLDSQYSHSWFWVTGRLIKLRLRIQLAREGDLSTNRHLSLIWLQLNYGRFDILVSVRPITGTTTVNTNLILLNHSV
jgi:hypothetical protein